MIVIDASVRTQGDAGLRLTRLDIRTTKDTLNAVFRNTEK